MLPNGYLQLDPVAQEDAGEYTCTATNQYGSDSSSGRLRVLGESPGEGLGGTEGSGTWEGEQVPVGERGVRVSTEDGGASEDEDVPVGGRGRSGARGHVSSGRGRKDGELLLCGGCLMARQRYVMTGCFCYQFLFTYRQ